MALIKSKQIESLHADKIIETSLKRFVTDEQILKWDSGTGSNATGKNIELTKNSTHVLWRVEDEESWNELISLSEITGPAGAAGLDGQDGKDGKNVELTKTDTHIVWRYSGQADGEEWTPLISLSDITGPAGADGSGTSLPNEDTVKKISEDADGNLLFNGDKLKIDIDTSNLVTQDDITILRNELANIKPSSGSNFKTLSYFSNPNKIKEV